MAAMSENYGLSSGVGSDTAGKVHRYMENNHSRKLTEERTKLEEKILSLARKKGAEHLCNK